MKQLAAYFFFLSSDFIVYMIYIYPYIYIMLRLSYVCYGCSAE